MHLTVHENIINPGEDANPATNFSVIAIKSFWPKLGSEPNFGIGLPKIGHPS